MFYGIKNQHWSLAKVSSLFVIFFFVLVISACSGNETDVDQEASDENSVAYGADVEGIIANNCLSCHGDDAPTMTEFQGDQEKFEAMMKGPRLDNYEDLIVAINGSEAGAIMRRLDNGENTDDGEQGNMYQYLGETEEEREENLETLKEWIGHWSLKRENELTDEDKEKFKLAK